MRRVIVGIFVFAIGLAGQASAQPANLIIVPGHSIGDISLGMTQTMVLNRLGLPDEITNYANGEATDVFWTYQQEEGRALVISWTRKDRQAGGVDFLLTDSRRFVTSKGVSIGQSRFAQVLDRYGAPDKVSPSGRGVTFYYNSLGVRFRVDPESDMIAAVTVIGRQ